MGEIKCRREYRLGGEVVRVTRRAEVNPGERWYVVRLADGGRLVAHESALRAA